MLRLPHTHTPSLARLYAGDDARGMGSSRQASYAFRRSIQRSDARSRTLLRDWPHFEILIIGAPVSAGQYFLSVWVFGFGGQTEAAFTLNKDNIAYGGGLYCLNHHYYCLQMASNHRTQALRSRLRVGKILVRIHSVQVDL